MKWIAKTDFIFLETKERGANGTRIEAKNNYEIFTFFCFVNVAIMATKYSLLINKNKLITSIGIMRKSFP